MSDCVDAAASLGLPTKVLQDPSQAGYPKGCYFFKKFIVAFNPHPAGGKQYESEPICGQGTVAKFEPHCFASEADYQQSYCDQQLERVQRDAHCDTTARLDGRVHRPP